MNNILIFIGKISIFISIILGVSFFCYLAIKTSNFNPQDFALGSNTSSKYGTYQNDIIAGIGADQDGLLKTFKKHYRKNNTILLIGASQVHAINRMQTNDLLAVEYLNRTSSGKPLFFQASTANASNHDLLMLYEFYRQHRLFPNYIVIAFVYDDLRENPVQKELLKTLMPITSEELTYGGRGVSYLSKEQSTTKLTISESAIKRNAINGTPQERLETKIIDFMDGNFPAFKYRSKLMAKIDAIAVQNIQSFIISISLIKSFSKISEAQRYPDIPENISSWNMDALESIIKLACHDKVNVIIYRQPIRPTKGPFYHNRQDYDKKWQMISDKYRQLSNVRICDFENIVPAEYWGETNLGYPDVFHFTTKGHELLADKIHSVIRNFNKP